MRKKQLDDIKMTIQSVLEKTDWFESFESPSDSKLLCNWNPLYTRGTFGHFTDTPYMISITSDNWQQILADVMENLVSYSNSIGYQDGRNSVD